jgi:8-oxo-dGTP pyrophosphatase MutT (NUDIX family)
MREVRLFSAEDFRRRVAERFGAEREEAVGDHCFNPDLAEGLIAMERRAAAVLVGVVRREPEATLLLTERNRALRSHAGEIAFPGGRIDPDDSGAPAAALREAEEEIGLEPAFVEVLGVGPDYLSGSGYRIAPVFALVRPDFELRLNPDEVADAFEVPLSFLMDPRNHREGNRMWKGAVRRFFEMPYRGRHIWGVTAGILRILYERLYADQPVPSR